MTINGANPIALITAGMADPTPSKRLMIAYGWASENLALLGGEASFSLGHVSLLAVVALVQSG
jgi:hypothetical protein